MVLLHGGNACGTPLVQKTYEDCAGIETAGKARIGIELYQDFPELAYGQAGIQSAYQFFFRRPGSPFQVKTDISIILFCFSVKLFSVFFFAGTSALSEEQPVLLRQSVLPLP